MAGIKFTLAGETFSSKAAVQKRVREILKVVGPVAQNEQPLVRALLDRHPAAAEKIGAGVRSFVVQVNQPYGTRGFWVERVDGTRTDFSYLECLNPSSKRDDFNGACRSAIVDQKLAAREAAFGGGAGFPIYCPITGDALTPGDCHVDHAPPNTFDQIVDDFIAARGLDLSAIKYLDGDGVIEWRFASAVLAQDFAAFHAERAALRVVSVRANLSLLRRGGR